MTRQEPGKPVAWCAGPPICTADRPRHETLPTMHRGRVASVTGGNGTVNSRIVQVEGEEARIVVQSTGYAIGGGAEMSLGAVEYLITNLTEQLEAARALPAHAPVTVPRQGGAEVAAPTG